MSDETVFLLCLVSAIVVLLLLYFARSLWKAWYRPSMSVGENAAELLFALALVVGPPIGFIIAGLRDGNKTEVTFGLFWGAGGLLLGWLFISPPKKKSHVSLEGAELDAYLMQGRNLGLEGAELGTYLAPGMPQAAPPMVEKALKTSDARLKQRPQSVPTKPRESLAVHLDGLTILQIEGGWVEVEDLRQSRRLMGEEFARQLNNWLRRNPEIVVERVEGVDIIRRPRVYSRTQRHALPGSYAKSVTRLKQIF